MLCQYHLYSCAGAYILLAEEEATNVSDALELFAKGAEAGERHLRKLNPHYFTHHQADFWMSMPTNCSPNPQPPTRIIPITALLGVDARELSMSIPQSRKPGRMCTRGGEWECA
jgi:hypothetical protein